MELSWSHTIFHSRHNSAGHLLPGWAAAFLLFFCLAGHSQAATFGITVVLSENTAPYREFADAFVRELGSDKDWAKVITSDDPIPSTDLVIAVGSKAAVRAGARKTPAILNVLITRSKYDELLHELPQRQDVSSFSSIFLDQPLSRQVHLLAAALPDRHAVGILYSEPGQDTAKLQYELNKHGYHLHAQAVHSEAALPQSLETLLEDSEVLLAEPDATIYNGLTIRNILVSTYRAKVPMIGYSAAYVRAGALCAIFSSPAQIAAQAARAAREFNRQGTLPPPQYPQEFEVLVNRQVAESLDINIKSDASLLMEIKAAEGDK